MNADEAVQKPIKVLVVENSRATADVLTHVLESDPRLRVVGVALTGEQALDAIRQSIPDVVTMDMHMTQPSGIDATRRIMETCPVPIVLVSGSSNADEVATTFRAIEAGALAVVERPDGVRFAQHEGAAKTLVNTVALMSEVKVVRRWPRPKSTVARCEAPDVKSPKRPVQVVAIGASTGGPLALHAILAGLPKDFPVPVLIVQHMTPGFAEGFVEWLGRSSGFPARVAIDGEILLPGHAYIAPDDCQMGVRSSHRVLLSRDPSENGTRPSVAFLFRSVAAIFGASAVGVLLSGMGRDGVDELSRLHAAGAITIAQDVETSVVHGMPGEAIRVGAAQHVLPPVAIARALATMATRP